jgi:hypothetical protein
VDLVERETGGEVRCGLVRVDQWAERVVVKVVGVADEVRGLRPVAEAVDL